MSSSRTSDLPIVLPPLLKQIGLERQDIGHLAGMSAKDLKTVDIPKLDLTWLGNQMYERQKQGRKLDPSADNYQEQLLALEDEAGFFKVLFGVWWREWDPFQFEEQLERLKANN